MSAEYDEYLKQHIENVKKAFDWLVDHIYCEYDPKIIDEWRETINKHDESKFSSMEYDYYDGYFYGTGVSKDDFNNAWLHHIHNNPHHWQHWVLINDEDGIECVKIPQVFVIEMICDWWSFSWKTGNLYEIFHWYDDHRYEMQMHKQTRKLVENILGAMRMSLYHDDCGRLFIDPLKEFLGDSNDAE